jgi:hypothetical protein
LSGAHIGVQFICTQGIWASMSAHAVLQVGTAHATPVPGVPAQLAGRTQHVPVVIGPHVLPIGAPRLHDPPTSEQPFAAVVHGVPSVAPHASSWRMGWFAAIATVPFQYVAPLQPHFGAYAVVDISTTGVQTPTPAHVGITHTWSAPHSSGCLRSHARTDPVLDADDDEEDDEARLELEALEALDGPVVLELEPPAPPTPPTTNGCPHAAAPRVAARATDSEDARVALILRRRGPSMRRAV